MEQQRTARESEAGVGRFFGDRPVGLEGLANGNGKHRLGHTLRQKVLPTTERINKTYQAYSPVYDLIFGKVFESGRHVSLELLDPKPGDVVLDAGVGTGLNLPLFPSYCKVVGIDLCAPMIRRAKDRAQQEGLEQVDFGLMDMQHLALADNSVDAVVSLYAISVVPDPVAAIREFKRVCKPGGKIVITNHFKSEHKVVGRVEELIATGATFLGFETDVCWEKLLRDAELVPRRVEKVNILNLSRAILCINPK
ncbi:MAG: class I SAM-dependent methyltransferase [Candidatus Schekmanbacteria bacterium]|nr:class I SAM-dependent methyltransferase [Candidatus Schekmanbacteria bacterium]